MIKHIQECSKSISVNGGTQVGDRWAQQAHVTNEDSHWTEGIHGNGIERQVDETRQYIGQQEVKHAVAIDELHRIRFA